MEQAKDLKWEDIKVGDHDSFLHTIIEADVADFARLSGDYNPLHMSVEYAAETKFEKRTVHGAFLGGLGSRLIGMYLPGKRCLFLSQNSQFKNPAFIDDVVEVFGQVKNKSESTKIIDIAIEVRRGKEILMSSEYKVQVL